MTVTTQADQVEALLKAGPTTLHEIRRATGLKSGELRRVMRAVPNHVHGYSGADATYAYGKTDKPERIPVHYGKEEEADAKLQKERERKREENRLRKPARDPLVACFFGGGA